VSVLILEGVTGAGKTSTIKALQRIASFELVDEAATFDDFVSEFSADPEAASRHARDRMTVILDQIEAAGDSRRHVLERFHFSQIALGSEWKWYRNIDDRCAALNCRVVVLALPDDQLPSRSLYRVEYDGADWQHLILLHGSEERALDALRRAQSARIDAIKQSCLPYRIVDASEKAWDRYAFEIARWMGWSAEGRSTAANVSG
jgi:hypothetical protein